MENHDSTQAFAELYEEFEKEQGRIVEGKRRKGRIFEITPEKILVDLHYKSNGILLAEDFTSEDMYTQYSVGDEVEWFVKSRTPDGVYLTVRSPERERRERRHTNPLFLDEANWKDKEFDAQITEVVMKGESAVGVSAVIEGERVFIPGSTFFTRRSERSRDLSVYVGKTIKAKVTEVKLHSSKEFATSIIASVEESIAKEEEDQRRQALSSIKKGDKIQGKVVRITNYGAFVDLGVGENICGLVFRNAISWDRVENVADYVSEGEEIEVQVIDVDMDKLKVTLSRKACLDRWEYIDGKYHVGDIIDGRVHVILNSGVAALVEIEPGLQGYLHISRIALKHIDSIEDEIKVGDSIRVKIIEIDKDKQRIALSRKDAILDENPQLAEEYRAEQAAREARNAERRERMERGESGERRKADRPQKSEDRPRRAESRKDGDAAHTEPRPERRRREEPDYTIPEQERSTTSLGSLLKGLKVDDEN